ncbi:MAG: VanZ family protein [Parcubacteria group bacterium GW2011_GWA1_Parcubacteria_45_10]|nr:MAG: VanZ family protein [Parcubacteria group bacterium GW2011_GWA1_Parcubacteria_45_10]
MTTMNKFIKFWLPVILWAALIFFFSSEALPPASRIYWRDFVVKKSAHIVEYAVFATLLFRAFINSGMERKKAAIYTLVLAMLYGITDEFHQSFTPGREPRIRDWIFDTIGAGFASYYLWKLLPKAPTRLKRWAESLQLS